MSWLKHRYRRVLRSLSAKWWPVKAPRLVAIAILTLLPAFAVAADILPLANFPRAVASRLLASCPRDRQDLALRQSPRPV